MNDKGPLEIEMAGVRFYSPQDELYFFTWLKNIGSVSSVFGQGRAIYAVLDRDELTFDDALEFISLFRRYLIPLSGLRRLDVPKISKRFSDPRAFWHSEVFGAASD